ncbi:MAG: AsmA family protein [Acidobacteria bacterium]|nr:AsmA family protein [Acidobacteriota bacterium]
MDSIHAEDHESHDARPARSGTRRRMAAHLRRFWIVYALLALVLGLAMLPPLVNVNRFRRRIATSIGGSLGRPVHLDNVSMSVFPLPGFVIENLVVDEDPAFGSEPIIRANTVRATLRLSSLWRRRVEFSTISFTEPSVNLVHTSAGKWNIEEVLMQASRIDAAPTTQRKAGSAPRFPYIEATGARLNFKMEQEKLPFSLVDSEFALWSPDPEQWRLRLRAHPTRTDTSISNAGIVELEATLGRGDSLAHIPLNLTGQWRDAPLGETSRVLASHDAGWRGNLALTTNIRGTIGEGAVTARLRLIGARRADFVPQQPLTAEIECFATATSVFHSFQDVRCSWPPNASSGVPTVAATGEIPNIRRLEDAQIQIGTSGVPAATVLGWLRVLTPGVADDITAAGTLTGSVSYNEAADRQWFGHLTVHDAELRPGADRSNESLIKGDISLSKTNTADTEVHRRPVKTLPSPEGFILSSTALSLGGHDPAVLEGHLDGSGYALHLTGPATVERLKQLGTALPCLGGGLDSVVEAATETAPVRVDLTSTHFWGDPSPRVWQDSSLHQTTAVAKTRKSH